MGGFKVDRRCGGRVIVVYGAAASGKSTWIKKQRAELEGKNSVVLHDVPSAAGLRQSLQRYAQIYIEAWPSDQLRDFLTKTER